MDFNDLTKKFLLGEWKKDLNEQQVNILSRTAAIKEALKSLKPRTKQESQRIELALENLSFVRRGYRKLEEQNRLVMEENSFLNEKLNLLEESRGDE